MGRMLGSRNVDDDLVSFLLGDDGYKTHVHLQFVQTTREECLYKGSKDESVCQKATGQEDPGRHSAADTEVRTRSTKGTDRSTAYTVQ